MTCSTPWKAGMVVIRTVLVLTLILDSQLNGAVTSGYTKCLFHYRLPPLTSGSSLSHPAFTCCSSTFPTPSAALDLGIICASCAYICTRKSRHSKGSRYCPLRKSEGAKNANIITSLSAEISHYTANSLEIENRYEFLSVSCPDSSCGDMNQWNRSASYLFTLLRKANQHRLERGLARRRLEGRVAADSVSGDEGAAKEHLHLNVE